MQRTAVHVIVRGRVQAVGYRQATRAHARSLGVTGWVRNRRDGSVEAVVEGDPAQVDALLDWMIRGPAAASVTSMDTEPASAPGAAGFEIRPTA